MGVKLNPFTGKLDVVDSPSGDFSTVELNQGTQTSPSISFDGDPNTGIYSPGADQLALATNGTGRLFINSAGSVGIGAAPSHALDVNGQVQAKAQIYLTDSSGDDVIRFTEIGSRDA